MVFDRLENIADYDDYNNVIFYPEEYKNEHSMFPLISFEVQIWI